MGEESAQVENEALEGYYVITRPPTTELGRSVVDFLLTTRLVNAISTRTFNRVTEDQYSAAAKAATLRIRRKRADQQEKNKEYRNRPEVKKRRVELENEPSKREARIKRRRETAALKRLMLSKLTRQQQEEALSEFHSKDNNDKSVDIE